MDSLTQIVLGAAVGEAVLGRKVGNKAVAWGAVAGTIPDLDVIPGHYMDTVSQVVFHRGMTHSLLFFIVLSPLLGYLARRIHKQEEAPWQQWSWLFFWALFTHALLDCFTTWGTQLFWPFTDYRLAFKSIFVIDPLYTIPFLICVVWLMFKPRGSSIRSRINYLGLAFSTGYLLLTLVNKQLMNERFEAILKSQGISYSRFATRPAPLNNILWAVTAETTNGFHIGYHSFFDSSSQIPLVFFPKNRDMLKGIDDDRQLQRLLEVMNGYYTVEKNGGSFILNDLRFGQRDGWAGGTDGFVFSYDVIVQARNGTKVQIDARPNTFPTDEQMLQRFWRRILGN